MEPTEMLITAGSFLMGGVVAWVWRSRRDLPERMRVVEHFERRARLAERDQERAIRTLNENELKVRKVEGTFEGLDGRVNELERLLEASRLESEARGKELQAKTKALALAEETLQELTPRATRQAEVQAALDGVRRELAQEEAALARAEARAEALEVKLEAFRDLDVELDARRGDLAEREEELRAVRARVAELAPLEGERAVRIGELEERDRVIEGQKTELATLRSQLAEFTGLRTECEGATRRVAQLEEARSELSGRLRDTEAERARVGTEAAGLERELEQAKGMASAAESRAAGLAEELERTRARLAELEPLEGRIEEMQRGRAEGERALREREAELGARVERLEDELASARGRVELLSPVEGRLGEVKEQLAAREQDWERRLEEARRAGREREDALRAESEARVDALQRENMEVSRRAATTEAEIARLRESGAESSRRVVALEAALGEEAARREALAKQLEATARERDTLIPLRAEVKESQAELSALQRKEKALGTQVQRSERQANATAEKLEAARRKLDAAKAADAARRKELADGKDRLAKLSASHRAIQLQSDRYSKRIEDLERALKEEKAQVAAERAAAKQAAVERTAAERSRRESRPVAKKAKAAARRDELDELAGVGPALAKKLVRAGIKNFEAIATLDRDGVDALAEKIGVSPSLIRRNRWVTTARRLHKQKYGSPVGS